MLPDPSENTKLKEIMYLVMLSQDINTFIHIDKLLTAKSKTHKKSTDILA